jgi:hypothetical protein
MDEVADMVGGSIMPNPTRVLASMIGVTIIGPKNIKEKTMPGFLWVRRSRMREALVWLKANNPLYADVTISWERLETVIKHSIPDEILAATRYSDDVKV